MALVFAALVAFIHYVECPLFASGVSEAKSLEVMHEVPTDVDGGDAITAGLYGEALSTPSLAVGAAKRGYFGPNSVPEEVSGLGLPNAADGTGVESTPNVDGSLDGTLDNDNSGLSPNGVKLGNLNVAGTFIELEEDQEGSSIPDTHKEGLDEPLVARDMPKIYGVKTAIISVVMIVVGVILCAYYQNLSYTERRKGFANVLRSVDDGVNALLMRNMKNLIGAGLFISGIGFLASGLLELFISLWRRRRVRGGHQTSMSPPMRGPIMLLVLLIFMNYTCLAPLATGKWADDLALDWVTVISIPIGLTALTLLLMSTVQKHAYRRRLADSLDQAKAIELPNLGEEN